MNGNLQVFDKANSIVAIRQKGAPQQDLCGRIRRIQAQAEREPESYRRSIVLQACRELLEEPSDGSQRFSLKDFVREEIHRLVDDELARYLFYRYRYDMFPQQKRIDDYPPCLQVEPASVCNYRCVFCYQTDVTFTNPRNGHMGIMGLDLFKRVIDQAEGHVEAVTLASRGEPLSCPGIESMLAHAAGKFLALKINTNAWFLDERLSHAILSAGVNTLVFSADACAEPLYSQLRVRGNLNRILKNIERFQEIRGKHYPGCRTITRVSGVRYTRAQDLDEMESYWGSLVDQVVFVRYNPWEKTYEMPENDIRVPCSELWRRIFVWFDGRVNPCESDYKSTLCVGRIQEHSLSELWRSEAYARLRRDHLAGVRGQRSPCGRCTTV